MIWRIVCISEKNPGYAPDKHSVIVIGDKEKLQTASGFAMDFVLNFVMCSSDFSCF